MNAHRVFRSALLATGALLIGACATPPSSDSAAFPSLAERKFQQEARAYQKVDKDGVTLYCATKPNVATLIPYGWCINEADLRAKVEDARRSRNPVTRPVLATTGSIG